MIVPRRFRGYPINGQYVHFKGRPRKVSTQFRHASTEHTAPADASACRAALLDHQYGNVLLRQFSHEREYLNPRSRTRSPCPSLVRSSLAECAPLLFMLSKETRCPGACTTTRSSSTD